MVVLYSPNYYYMAISNLTTPPIDATIQTLSGNIDNDISAVNDNTIALLSQVDTLISDIAASSSTNSNEDKLKTSISMYDDSRNLYITKLLENYLLFISICGVGYGIYKSNKTNLETY